MKDKETQDTVVTLRLCASDLTSKWGFRDGDLLQSAASHLALSDAECELLGSHAELIRLVREHLLPELARNHRISVTELETLHNPIRAVEIDGVPVDWFASWDRPLTPECIELRLTPTAEGWKPALDL